MRLNPGRRVAYKGSIGNVIEVYNSLGKVLMCFDDVNKAMSYVPLAELMPVKARSRS